MPDIVTCTQKKKDHTICGKQAVAYMLWPGWGSKELPVCAEHQTLGAATAEAIGMRLSFEKIE
jgi:hypothetical protein